MVVCRYLLLAPLLLGAGLSCSEYGNVGRAKFITHHGFRAHKIPAWYLINAVQRSSWVIHYGFSDNDRCRSVVDDTDDFEQQLKESMRAVLRLWLQPLRATHAGIVDRFDLVRKNTVPVTHNLLLSVGATQEVAREQGGDALLSVTFNCMHEGGKMPVGRDTYPRSFVWLAAVPQVFMFHYRKPGTDCSPNDDMNCRPVAERDQREIFPDDKMSDEHMFMLTTLLHEVGHAFGLSDVYVERDKSVQSNRKGVNQSTGGSEFTVGEQPNSIMGVASIVGLRDGDLVLTTDDEEAIKWLYLQAHEGMPLDSCPTDYKVEESTEGCLPRFPLIAAVREGNLEAVNELSQDNSLDIDSCDRYGKTALYYARQGKHGHGEQMAKLLLAAGADSEVVCPVIDQFSALNFAVAETNLDLPDDNNAEEAAGEVFDAKKHLSRCGTLAAHASSFPRMLWLLLILPVLAAGMRRVVGRCGSQT